MNYTEYGPWLQEQLGTKVQKISVNAGFTCPNRDGTVGYGGCTFCNNQTFNPEYCQPQKIWHTFRPIPTPTESWSV